MISFVLLFDLKIIQQENVAEQCRIFKKYLQLIPQNQRLQMNHETTEGSLATGCEQKKYTQ